MILSLLKSHWKIVFAAVVLLIMGATLLWWPVPQPSVASFVVQPGERQFKKGDQFTVKVGVDSAKAANAVDATVSYPSDELDVMSTSSKNTRFDMVLFPAQVDKSKGTVRYLQATAAPFTGRSDKGLVGTVTFKARQDGTVTFGTSGKIVANDSVGTDLSAKRPDKKLWETIFRR